MEDGGMAILTWDDGTQLLGGTLVIPILHEAVAAVIPEVRAEVVRA